MEVLTCLPAGMVLTEKKTYLSISVGQPLPMIGNAVYGPNKIGCWRVINAVVIQVGYTDTSNLNLDDYIGSYGIKDEFESKNIYFIVPENEIACAQQSANQIKTFTEEEFARSIKIQ